VIVAGVSVGKPAEEWETLLPSFTLRLHIMKARTFLLPIILCVRLAWITHPIFLLPAIVTIEQY
jgi:hypothetical protein